MVSGDGNPPLFVTANQGNDTVSGSGENDTIFGGKESDLLEGEDGNDEIFANIGNDTVFGGQGQDMIFGNQGSDSLEGGEGNDTIYGGKENDTIVAGVGQDLMFGDLGDDTFLINAVADVGPGDVFDGDNDSVGNSGTDTLIAAANLGDVNLNEASIIRLENIEIGQETTLIVTQDQIDTGLLRLNGAGFIQAAPDTEGGELDLTGLDELTVGVKDASGQIIQQPMTPGPGEAITVEFTQSNWTVSDSPVSGSIVGSFTGEDLNGDGLISVNDTENEVTDFRLTSSVGILFGSFGHVGDDLANLSYDIASNQILGIQSSDTGLGNTVARSYLADSSSGMVTTIGLFPGGDTNTATSSFGPSSSVIL